MFAQYLAENFRPIVVSTVDLLNGSAAVPSPYLHRRMLRTVESVSGKWESILSKNTQVRADVIAMDSSIPLKMRDSVSQASGDIPKSGQERKLNETQLTDLQVLRTRPNAADNLDSIIEKVFEDTPKVITAVYELNEEIFLEGLSTGMVGVTDIENVGVGVRVDYGVKSSSKFGASTVAWSNIAAKPLDDIKRVQARAKIDGNRLTTILMDNTAFDNMARTTQVKEAYVQMVVGFAQGSLPTPALDQVQALLRSRFGMTIEIVDRTIVREIDGIQTPVTPWQDGAVTFTASSIVGSLVFAQLAEAANRVAGVNYQIADRAILVSKFRLNRPSLSEVTNSQARMMPVISSPIYLLDSKTIQA